MHQLIDWSKTEQARLIQCVALPWNSPQWHICHEPNDVWSSKIRWGSSAILRHENNRNTEVRRECRDGLLCRDSVANDLRFYNNDGKAHALLFDNCSFKGHWSLQGADSPPQMSGSSRTIPGWFDKVIGLSGLGRRRQGFASRRSSLSSGVPATRANNLVLARCRRGSARLQSRCWFSFCHIVFLRATNPALHKLIASPEGNFAIAWQNCRKFELLTIGGT